jgi:L-fucose mutarotase
VLKGIHPLLSADLLHALQSMGHGDSIAIVDANFPAAANAKRLIESPGTGAPALLEAVLTVLPLDTRITPAVFTMEVTGDPEAIPPPVADFAAVMTALDLADMEIGHLERNAFYERASGAYAIVRTGESRRFGNILLVKGVIASD